MLFILLSLISLTAAIRVDWNTNKGPIVPPITTVRPVPKPPFKEPAPVWENQSDEINPNMYQYLLPPPSRPKFPTDNYARAPILPENEYRYQQQPNYGQVITPYSTIINDNFNNNDNIGNYNLNNIIKTVPTLAVYYVPNIGLKYDAVVPSSVAKAYYLKENDIYDKFNTKLNGKYNYKLKKYKAYEKMKYIPNLYYMKQIKDQYHQSLPYITSQEQQNTFEKFSSTEQPFYDSQKLNSQNTKNLYRTQQDLSLFKKQSLFSKKEQLLSQEKQQWQYKNSINDLTSNSKPQR